MKINAFARGTSDHLTPLLAKSLGMGVSHPSHVPAMAEPDADEHADGAGNQGRQEHRQEKIGVGVGEHLGCPRLLVFLGLRCVAKKIGPERNGLPLPSSWNGLVAWPKGYRCFPNSEKVRQLRVELVAERMLYIGFSHVH